MTKKTLVYDNELCNQFVEDMETAGIAVEHYRGRFYWQGPAARTTDQFDAQDIIRATTVKLQRDDMGLGSIHYPVPSGRLVKEDH